MSGEQEGGIVTRPGSRAYPTSPLGEREAGEAGRVPTLVYGAGTIGAQVLRTIAAAPDGLGMRVVGLIDDSRAKRNHGILRPDCVPEKDTIPSGFFCQAGSLWHLACIAKG